MSPSAKEVEAARKLSPAEEKRLARFEAMAAAMEAEGYVRKDLTVGIVAANVVAIAVAIPLFTLFIWLFYLANGGFSFSIGYGSFLLFLVVLLVLVVVHELLHGATWAIFAPRHFKDIEFGFMVKYLTPYCTCTVPLGRGQYIAGALAPLVVLGIIPTAVAFPIGSFETLIMGLIMIVSAMGDIMIVVKMLRYKSDAAEVVYCDHPTQAGMVVFER